MAVTLSRDPLVSNKSTLTNGDNTNYTYNLYKYHGTPIANANFIEVSTNNGLLANGTATIDGLLDGLYRIYVMNGVSVVAVITFTSDYYMEQCRIAYLKKILACDDDNCNGDCLGNEKLYYNFSVISEMYNLYLTLIQGFVDIGYYDDVNMPYPVGSLFTDIAKVIDRFQAYCQECIEPCNNC
jgi:hypothetical protein